MGRGKIIIQLKSMETYVLPTYSTRRKHSIRKVSRIRERLK